MLLQLHFLLFSVVTTTAIFFGGRCGCGGCQPPQAPVYCPPAPACGGYRYPSSVPLVSSFSSRPNYMPIGSYATRAGSPLFANQFAQFRGNSLNAPFQSYVMPQITSESRAEFTDNQENLDNSENPLDRIDSTATDKQQKVSATSMTSEAYEPFHYDPRKQKSGQIEKSGYHRAQAKAAKSIREKCSSPRLREIIDKSITDSISLSKLRISQLARKELGYNFDVICSTTDFSYLISSNIYCQTGKNGIICLAFEH